MAPWERLEQLGPVVILIRHADVTPDGGVDPPLNAAGTSRAQQLRRDLRELAPADASDGPTACR